MRTQLATNFYLDEFLVSETAVRVGIDMTPPAAIVEQLRLLCIFVLQPLRDELDTGITITSGYRPLALNRQIGSHDNSDHIAGRAADVRAAGVTPINVCRCVHHLSAVGRVRFRQAIHEFGAWAHVSIWRSGTDAYASDAPSEMLTAYRDDSGTRYKSGLVAVDPQTGRLA